MFLFAIFVGVVFCSWNQHGHDEKWSFQSTFKGTTKDWIVTLNGTRTNEALMVYPFLMDDERGNLWIMEDIYKDYFGYQSWMKVVDANSGSVVQEFLVNDRSYYSNGLFYDDKFVLYNSVKSSEKKEYYIQGINVNGTTDWTSPLPKETIYRSIITENGVLIYAIPKLTTDCDFIIAKQYGSSENLWNISFPSEKRYKFDFFNILGDNFYFQTENENQKAITWTWYVVNIPTGKIVSTYEYDRGHHFPSFWERPFMIDADKKQGYIVDNSFGDSRLTCLSTDNLKVKWKAVMKGTVEGENVTCSRTFLEENGLLYIFCEENNAETKEWDIFGCSVDSDSGKQGNCVKFLSHNIFSAWDGVHQIKDGEYVFLFDKNAGILEYNSTLYVVDTKVETVKTLDVQQNIYRKPISDASGCVYYCYGTFGENNKCTKKC